MNKPQTRKRQTGLNTIKQTPPLTMYRPRTLSSLRSELCYCLSVQPVLRSAAARQRVCARLFQSSLSAQRPLWVRGVRVYPPSFPFFSLAVWPVPFPQVSHLISCLHTRGGPGGGGGNTLTTSMTVQLW